MVDNVLVQYATKSIGMSATDVSSAGSPIKQSFQVGPEMSATLFPVMARY